MSLIQLSPSNGDSLLINSGTFSTGKIIRSRNELVFYTDNYGNTVGYHWLGSLPHTISGTSPSTDGGINSIAWEGYINVNLYEKLKAENITLTWTAHLPTLEVAYGLKKGSLNVWSSGLSSSSSQYWLYSDGTIWGGVGTLGESPAAPFTQIHLQRDIIKYNYTIPSNGTSTIFVPYTFSSIEVYVNGVLQDLNSYSVSGQYITFTSELIQGDSIQAFLNDVPISSVDYVLKSDLGNFVSYESIGENNGASLIGTSNGLTIQNEINSKSFISILDYIDPSLWKYLNNPTTAETYVGDLYNTINQAMMDAAAAGKDLVFCGPTVYNSSSAQSWYFPISTPLTQVEGCSIKSSGIGRNYLIPTSSFPSNSFLLSWAPGTGQPRMYLDGLGFSGGNYKSNNIGGFRIQRGVYTSIVRNLFIRDCYYGGFLIKTENASGQTVSSDMVNLTIDTIFILNSGNPSYYQAFDIQLSTAWGSGEWTDGSVRNVDISTAFTDNTSITKAPVSLNIYNYGKQMFNVLFERFYTSAKANTHVKIYSNSNIRNTNLSFQNFSGDGITKTALPMIDIDGLGWSNLSNMYRGSLINAGLRIKNSVQCTFDNFVFNAATDASGNYQKQLQIDSTCDTLMFSNCFLRNMYTTTTPYNFKEWFTTWIVDGGINTIWNGNQLSSNVVVQRSFDYFNTVSNSKCTNALTQNNDIVAVANFDNLQLTYPLSSGAASPTISFPISTGYRQGNSAEQYIYVMMKIKCTSATIGIHYFRFNIYDTNITWTPDTLNLDTVLIARIPVSSTATNKNMVITLGATAQTTSAVTYQIGEIAITSGELPWPTNYRKSLQVI